jgi:hypothetical protein
MHAISAWDLKFRVSLGYTLTPAFLENKCEVITIKKEGVWLQIVGVEIFAKISYECLTIKLNIHAIFLPPEACK